MVVGVPKWYERFSEWAFGRLLDIGGMNVSPQLVSLFEMGSNY